MEERSLFANPGVLEQEYLPRLLPYRENQHKYIADCLKPLFAGRNGRNLLITGSPGIGKTASIRFVFRKLTEETDRILPVYVNCWKHDTTFKIISSVAELFDIRTEKKPIDEVFELMLKRMKQFDAVAFAFDEIDRIQDTNFLYRFLEDVPLKSIFLITNMSEWVAHLDRRILSRLMIEKLEFKPYNLEETRGILKERVQYAFAPYVWEPQAFEAVARKTYELKDIRLGLFLLKESGEIAEARNAEKIGVAEVEEAIRRIKDFYERKTISNFYR